MRRCALWMLVAGSAGCWTDVQEVRLASWADDDTEIAGVRVFYEDEKSGDQTRNDNWQIVKFDPAGKETGSLGSPEFGTPIGPLYYMKSSGYLLLRTEGIDGVSAPFVQKVDLSGNIFPLWEIPTADSCADVQVIPSPGSGLLAVVTTNVNCLPEVVKAQFITPAGDTLGAEQTFTFVDPAEATWLPDGTLVLTDGQTAKAWSQNTEPADTTVPGCTAPTTSSSAVSSTGQEVTPAGDGVSVGADGAAEAFGCQVP